MFISSSSFHRSHERRRDVQRQRRQVQPVPQGQASCGDCHDIWIDPKDPVRYVLTDDGGARDQHAERAPCNVSLPNGQMYHVHVDNRVPYWIYSNRQDDGTMRGPIDGVGADRQRPAAGGSTMPQPAAGAAAAVAGVDAAGRGPGGRTRRAVAAGAPAAPRGRPTGAAVAAARSAAAAAAATSCVAARTSAAASPASRFPMPDRRRTSSTRAATATR